MHTRVLIVLGTMPNLEVLWFYYAHTWYRNTQRFSTCSPRIQFKTIHEDQRVGIMI